MSGSSEAERQEHKRNNARIDAAIASIERRLGPGNYSLYSEEELRVLLARVFVQVVENGGFALFFEHPMPADQDYSRTSEAVDAVGATGASEVLREALSQFRGQRPPLDPLERATEYRALPEATRRRLDSEILDCVPEITRRLAAYIEARLPG